MEDLIGVTISDRESFELHHLRPLLEAWIKAVMRYCRLQGFQDNPWWVNERGNLSILAGAAWTMTGWAALAGSPARKLSGKECAAATTERFNLYVCSRYRRYAFEAAQARQSLGEGGDADAVQEALRQAWTDAGNLDVAEEDYGIAATFVVPRVVQADSPRTSREVRELVVDWLAGNPFEFEGRPHASSPDALAYVFPGDLLDSTNRLAQWPFPGVALALFVRKRGTRRNPKG
jgi:hypothetical protein